MRVYRLTRREYARLLDGKGAAKSNNRWNTKGVEIAYTAESRALALCEVFVHLSLNLIPESFVMVEIEIPDSLHYKTILEGELPKGWRTPLHFSVTQKIGDTFINAGKDCVLKVPSAVVPGDFNFLINPHHSDAKKIKVHSVSDFLFDDRMRKNQEY
ncbi:MAG: RES domain-containing protein [Bacteroidetes bacterium]|nr:RES domain-containing protein [Bacteroidota bacterium]